MIKNPIIKSNGKDSSKTIPIIKSEAVEYFHASKMQVAKFINLKPSLKKMR
jgi:hypothetical protein